MKRLLPLLLLLAILTPSLASCGGKTPAAATVPATEGATFATDGTTE